MFGSADNCLDSSFPTMFHLQKEALENSDSSTVLKRSLGGGREKGLLSTMIVFIY